MKRRDVLRGLDNCMLTVQHIVQGWEKERLTEEEIKRRIEYDFSHRIADYIVKSDKLQVQTRDDDFNMLSNDTICRTEIYVFTESELAILVDNVKMKVWEDVRNLQSLVHAVELEEEVSPTE